MPSKKLDDNAVKAWYKGTILYQFKKEWVFGRRKIQIEKRSKSNVMGRFGGGWNWKLGIACSKTTTIIYLLVLSVDFKRLHLCVECQKPITDSHKYAQLPDRYGYNVEDFGYYHPYCYNKEKNK